MEVIGEDGQQGAAKERHIGQEVGIAGARTIFPHQGVTPPVITDFDATPVSPNQVQPLMRLVLCRWGAGQIVARLIGGGPGLFDRPLAAQDDQCPGIGKVGLERFDGKGMQGPDLEASAPRIGVGKKGVSGNPSKPWACLRRLGWLPLIWNR